MAEKDVTLGPATKVSATVMWGLLLIAAGSASSGTKLLLDIRSELRSLRDEQYTRQQIYSWAVNMQGMNSDVWVPDPLDPSRRVMQQKERK